MKTRLLFLGLIMASSMTFAQSNGLTDIMKTTLSKMNDAEDNSAYLDAVNMFERVASAQTSEWLPAYYTAYGNANLSFSEKDIERKEGLIQKAEKFHQQAKDANGDMDELLVLEGMIYQARIQIDPATMGMIYGPKATNALKKAIESNSENPRAALLLGRNLYYTPEMYGGGPKVACEILSSAAAKFKAFSPKSELHPNWGADQLEGSLKMCHEID